MTDFRRLSILVVDNSSLMRNLLREVLTQFGLAQIEMASNAEEARRRTRQQKFDIIILDFFLGEVDGGDFARELRRDQDNVNRKVPILLITALPDHHKVRKARDSGVNAILAKPIKTRDLYLRIHAILADPRPFIETEGYIGPSRSKQTIGAMEQRRLIKRQTSAAQAPAKAKPEALVLSRVAASTDEPPRG
jgi:CheY-like chemotaxis protein